MTQNCLPVTRRFACLAAASAVAFALLSPATFALNFASEPESLRAARRLLNLFGDLDAPMTIGQQYLVDNPQEADSHWIAEQLMSKTPQLGSTTCHAALAAQIKADFAQQEIAKVDGWILSRTEARVCALASLLSTCSVKAHRD